MYAPRASNTQLIRLPQRTFKGVIHPFLELRVNLPNQNEFPVTTQKSWLFPDVVRISTGPQVSKHGLVKCQWRKGCPVSSGTLGRKWTGCGCL